jgi:hypothetical protein
LIKNLNKTIKGLEMLDYSKVIREFRDEVKLFKKRYEQRHDFIDEETGCYDQDLIPGLCPKKCSCDQCREARKSDHAYMKYVDLNR